MATLTLPPVRTVCVYLCKIGACIILARVFQDLLVR